LASAIRVTLKQLIKLPVYLIDRAVVPLAPFLMLPGAFSFDTALIGLAE